jgi:hypothetical protein
MKKGKPPYTAKTIFAELDQIRQAYKKAWRGYRDQIYSTMQSAQKLIVRLERNDRLRRDFVKQLKHKKRKRGRTDQAEFHLSIEVAALAIGAASRKPRQKAWKHAKVLDYFRKKGVDVTRTARTIKAKGGIEKILKEIAREGALTEAADGKTSTKGTSGKISEAARGSESDRESDEEHIERADGAKHGRISLGVNDKEIKVSVWMKLSDRDEMEAEQVGTRFKLFGLRVGQKGGDFKITKIKKITKIRAAVDVSNDEWDD